MKFSQDCRIGCSFHVTAYELAQGRYPPADIIRRNMARDVGELVVKKNMRVIEGEDGAEFRFDLYVLTPGELVALVSEEARRLAEGRPGSWEKQSCES